MVRYGVWRSLGVEKTELRNKVINIMTANDQPKKILGITALVIPRMADYVPSQDFVVADFL